MLTKEQLAKELNVSERTLDNWRKDGLPHIKRGKFIRFELDKVIDWLKSTDK